MRKAAPVQIVFENSTKSYNPDKPKRLLTHSFAAEKMMQFENVLMDTSHIATAKLDIINFYKKLKGEVRYTHLSDSDSKLHEDRPTSIADRHLTPSKGKLPLRGFLRHLRETNFKSIISI